MIIWLLLSPGTNMLQHDNGINVFPCSIKSPMDHLYNNAFHTCNYLVKLKPHLRFRLTIILENVFNLKSFFLKLRMYLIVILESVFNLLNI